MILIGMLQLNAPSCPITAHVSKCFCFEEDCSQPAFCCSDECLKQNHHHNGRPIMFWDQFNEHFRHPRDTPLSQADLLKLDKQQKELQTVIESLHRLKCELSQKSIQLRKKLVYRQDLNRILICLKKSITSNITGADMYKAMKILKSKDYFTNNVEVEAIIATHNRVLDRLLQTTGNLIRQYDDVTMFRVIRPVSPQKRKADELRASIKPVELRQCKNIYTNIIKQNKGNGVADDSSLYGRGITNQQLNLFDQAIIDFTEAIEINSDVGDYYAHRAWSLYATSKYQKAVDDCDIALEKDHKHEWARALKSYCRLKLFGKDEDMKELQKQGNQHYETCHRIMFLRGSAYFMRNEPQKAIADLTQAIKLREHLNYYQKRARCYKKNKKTELAIQDLTRAIEIKPNASCYNIRGLCYNERQQYDKAISDFTEAIRLDKSHADYYCNRGISYKQKGLYDNAVNDYTKSITLNPKKTYYYSYRATALEKVCRTQQAKSDRQFAKSLANTLVPPLSYTPNV